MIKKTTIIISSYGRTGTSFFANFFQNNFNDIISLHEPGRIEINKLGIKTIAKTVKTYGFINSILKKIIGKWDITQISIKRMAGKISREEAARILYRQRKKIINKFNKNIYIESNYHFFGLIDVLPLVFKNHKAIYIIRDPREWVQSWMNLGVAYSKTDIHLLAGNRPTPAIVGDKKFIPLWKKINKFEKLCWAWNAINNYAVKTIKKNSNAKLFFFEDLFVSNNKVENMQSLINFIMDANYLKSNKPKNLKIIIEKALNKKINKSSNNLPKWTEWTPEQAKKLNEICGSTMKKFGYGNEHEWKKLINL